MPYREFTISVVPHLADAGPAMTWKRLREKLRAHGVPGWCDESSVRVRRNDGSVQLATWENERGST